MNESWYLVNVSDSDHYSLSKYSDRINIGAPFEIIDESELTDIYNSIKDSLGWDVTKMSRTYLKAMLRPKSNQQQPTDVMSFSLNEQLYIINNDINMIGLFGEAAFLIKNTLYTNRKEEARKILYKNMDYSFKSKIKEQYKITGKREATFIRINSETIDFKKRLEERTVRLENYKSLLYQNTNYELLSKLDNELRRFENSIKEKKSKDSFKWVVDILTGIISLLKTKVSLGAFPFKIFYRLLNFIIERGQPVIDSVGYIGMLVFLYHILRMEPAANYLFLLSIKTIMSIFIGKQVTGGFYNMYLRAKSFFGIKTIRTPSTVNIELKNSIEEFANIYSEIRRNRNLLGDISRMESLTVSVDTSYTELREFVKVMTDIVGKYERELKSKEIEMNEVNSGEIRKYRNFIYFPLLLYIDKLNEDPQYTKHHEFFLNQIIYDKDYDRIYKLLFDRYDFVSMTANAEVNYTAEKLYEHTLCGLEILLINLVTNICDIMDLLPLINLNDIFNKKLYEKKDSLFYESIPESDYKNRKIIYLRTKLNTMITVLDVIIYLTQRDPPQIPDFDIQFSTIREIEFTFEKLKKILTERDFLLLESRCADIVGSKNERYIFSDFIDHVITKHYNKNKSSLVGTIGHQGIFSNLKKYLYYIRIVFFRGFPGIFTIFEKDRLGDRLPIQA